MYRISVKAKQKNKDYSFIDFPGAWSVGYFGPCSKSDLNVFPDSVLEKINNPDKYINFSELALDESRRKVFVKFLKDNGIGNLSSYASFRNDKSKVVIFCKTISQGGVPKFIHFLRPEYSRLFGFEDEPVIINSWSGLGEDARNVISENNYIASAGHFEKNRFGRGVILFLYTGENEEILKWQKEVLNNAPGRLLEWSRFLEADSTKPNNQYASNPSISRVLQSDLNDDEKQELLNRTIEKYYFGLGNISSSDFRLFKYTISEDDIENYDPKIAGLKITKVINKKSKFSRSRSIVTDGFTLEEWRDYVLGGSIPPAISDGLSTEKITELLNGVLKSGPRTSAQPKIKYTGKSTHTLEKMRLTGLSADVYYSQNEWYESLSKVRFIEDVKKQKPYNIEAQKKYKNSIENYPLFEEYKAELGGLDLSASLGEESLKSLLNTTGAWFRQRAKRAGNNAASNYLKGLFASGADAFTIRQFFNELQDIDNNFIESLYTDSLGSSGEQIMQDSLTKGLSNSFKYQRTFSVNVSSLNNQKYLLIFDGVILDKEDKVVMLFEYQGPQHYSFNPAHYKTYEDFQQRLFRDKLKLDFCKKNNIPLFTISHVINSKEAQGIYLSIAKSGALSSYVPKAVDVSAESNVIDDSNLDWLDEYVDNLVASHFSPIMSMSNISLLEQKIKRIINDLSKLVMIAIGNDDKFSDTSFMQGFSKDTLLDEGHKKVVDSFNKQFGEKFKLDYQDNVFYLGSTLKPKSSEVSEVSFEKSLNKRYKIKRVK